MKETAGGSGCLMQGAQPVPCDNGKGWGGGMGGVQRRGHVCLWLIPVDAWQRPTQHRKAIILQLKKKNQRAGRTFSRMWFCETVHPSILLCSSTVLRGWPDHLISKPPRTCLESVCCDSWGLPAPGKPVIGRLAQPCGEKGTRRLPRWLRR